MTAPPTIKSSCTDRELDTAVAVALGIPITPEQEFVDVEAREVAVIPAHYKPYSTDANCVLDLLNKLKAKGWWVEIKDHTNGIQCGERDWLVILANFNPSDDDAELPRDVRYIEGVAPTFCRAACFALLRANGVEVVE